MRYSLVMVSLFLLSTSAFAAGGHEDLSCTGCHEIHDAKGDVIFALEPNLESINPRTDAAYTGMTALCLSCHEETGGMGILPVSGGTSHPYGIAVDPKIADVPAQLLRDDRLECVGCHDPHPSNVHYMYLRVATGRGAQMQDFCSLCHYSKSGRRIDPSRLFDSMDERQASPAVSPAAPVSPSTD